MRVLVGFLIGGFLFSIQSCCARETAMTLDSKIKAGQTEQITRVRRSEDWKNPFIVIYDSEVMLTWSHPRKSKSIKIEKLAEELSAIPISAWPYGRIVAVQECGIGSGEQQAKQNRKHAWEHIKAVFRELNIVMNPWPSA